MELLLSELFTIMNSDFTGCYVYMVETQENIVEEI